MSSIAAVIAAILAALMMLISPGFTDVSDNQDPVFFKLRADVDAGGMITVMQEADESLIPSVTNEQAIRLVTDLADIFSIRGVLAQEAMQLDLCVSGSPLVNVGCQNHGNGFAVASSVLGSHVLTFSDEAIELMRSQEDQDGLSYETMEAIRAAFLRKDEIVAEARRVLDGIAGRVCARVEGWEPGSYELDGLIFTGRAVPDMTVNELMVMVLNGMKELAQIEPVAGVITAIDPNLDVAAWIDMTIQEDLSRDRDACVISVYTNEDGDCYVAFDGPEEAENDDSVSVRVHFAYGLVNGRCHVRYSSEYSISMGFAISYSSIEKMGVSFASGRDFLFEYDGQTVFDISEALNDLMTSYSDSNECTISRAADGAYSMTVRIERPMSDSSSMVLEFQLDTTHHQAVNPINGTCAISLDSDPFILADFSGQWGRGGEITLTFDGEGVQPIAADVILTGGDASQELRDRIFSIALPELMEAVSAVIKNLPDDSAGILTSVFGDGFYGYHPAF